VALCVYGIVRICLVHAGWLMRYHHIDDIGIHLGDLSVAGSGEHARMDPTRPYVTESTIVGGVTYGTVLSHDDTLWGVSGVRAIRDTHLQC
jgi:hypothetical protein